MWTEGRNIIVLILLASFALRSLMLGSRDLDLDEAFSFFLVTDHSFVHLMSPFSSAITGDAHPPIYYLFTHLWMHSGYPLLRLLSASREFAFRFPFAFFGAFTTYVMYRIGERAACKKLGLILAFTHALTSFSVQIAHQARMYTLVEMLSAIILLKGFSPRSSFTFRDSLSLGLLSSLLFLIHYASIFFLLVIWVAVVWRFRARIKPLVVALLISAASLAWWVPGLLTQLSREAASSTARFSTGTIIPFTLFQFFSGDRALSLGSPVAGRLHVFAIFGTALFLAFLMVLIWNLRRELSGMTKFIAILLVPLTLHWLATFKISRIFNGTHYAIYSLPAFLLLICIVTLCAREIHPHIPKVMISLFLAVNAATLYSFYDNSLVPYEPWNQACGSMRAANPRKVYIYPSYMSVLLRFYGPDLPVIDLPGRCSRFSIEVDEIRPQTNQEADIFLVLSHDRGQGLCYQEMFRQAFEQKPSPYSFHNIRIYTFRGTS
ncbi:MAG: hypothetical protein JRJ29_03830 [Deltaproteobacteria bacterium]|nr:hypothetical protein [Deltaproteobacteria bacterium]